MDEKERQLIGRLLSVDFSGRDQIIQQLEDADVECLDCNGSISIFVKSVMIADQVKYVVPTEGEYEDDDGVTVHILLFVEHGKVTVLEIYREDNAAVHQWPSQEAVRVFAPD